MSFGLPRSYGTTGECGLPAFDMSLHSTLDLSESTEFTHSHQPGQVESALEETLSELDLEYVDLYLMHWPVAFTANGNTIDYVDVGCLFGWNERRCKLLMSVMSS